MLELIQPYIHKPPFYLAHMVCTSLEWSSVAALQLLLKHYSTCRQVPQRKGCSILPSKMPKSCPVTCVDSAGLLAPTSSISHADVPHTIRENWKKPKRYVPMKEGKTGNGRDRREKTIPSLWRNINPSPCCSRFSLKLVLHSAIAPKGLAEVLFFCPL